ncbi:MAG: hypothetical protein P4K83_01265 [Terracidiphilus sp.]|nr:hypothetical protein [Terracidiphilus sp.]
MLTLAPSASYLRSKQAQQNGCSPFLLNPSSEGKEHTAETSLRASYKNQEKDSDVENGFDVAD